MNNYSKNIFLFSLVVVLSTTTLAQKDSLIQPSSKQHSLELNLTQNTASLLSPSLNPIRPAIVVLNYNYGTQFSTPLGSELNNMKRALYSAVINP